MNFQTLRRIFSRAASAPLQDDQNFRKKILVVEDYRDLRKLLVLNLNEFGYDTTEAITGLEGLKKTRAEHPDLILMDLGMPVADGDQAIRWLKADPLTRDIPVVVITALLFGPALDRAIAAGAAEIVHKPFDIKSLDEIIQRHLSLRGGPLRQRQ
jgi:two-component system, OmpR family, phosphate regulon response regulator PhoB